MRLRIMGKQAVDSAKITLQEIDTFFIDYAARFNQALSGEADIEATAGAFAECFIEASPNGVNCGKNDEQFRTVIPQGIEFYKSIGTKSMKVYSRKVTPLDAYHAMVKVHWQALYLKKDGIREMIGFDVYYLLQKTGEKPKIFAYITGDEQKVLREHGLVPA